MDKYEYKVRADEIKELIAEGEYGMAAEIADGIDWRRVKSVMMLCTISDLYKINKRYEDAKNMLLLAYDRRPGGRTICYSLCELCIKTGDLVQALNSYREFVQVAPRDSGRYILQYKLYVAQDVGLKERIGVLEELKKKDYREKWAYELARLYHKAELGARCVEECDELIACFGYGRYVIKAMELKMLYQPLTLAQQETYEHRFESYEGDRQEAVEAEQYEGEEACHSKEEYADGQGGAGQSGYAREGYTQESYAGEGYEAEEGYGGDGGYPQEGYEIQGGYPQEGYETEGGYGAEDAYDRREEYAGEGNYSSDGDYGSGGNDGQASEDDLDIQVKTVDVGRFNTINLQAELAAGLQEVLGADNEELVRKESEEKEESRAGRREEENPAAGTQVHRAEEEGREAFGDSFEGMGETEGEADNDISWQEAAEDDIRWQETEAAQDGTNWQEAEAAEEESWQEMEEPKQIRDQTAEQVMEQMRLEHTGEIPAQSSGESQKSGKILQMPGAKPQEAAAEKKGAAVDEILAAVPPKELAGVLSQESDGQISFVLPERNTLEKQLTGQMKIEDILAEWERTKKRNEEKCREEIRQNVLRNTGPMFTEFEAAARDGLLEQLEGSPEGEAPREEIEEITQDEQMLPEEIAEFEELEEFWESEQQENNVQDEAVYEDEAIREEKPAAKTRAPGTEKVQTALYREGDEAESGEEQSEEILEEPGVLNEDILEVLDVVDPEEFGEEFAEEDIERDAQELEESADSSDEDGDASAEDDDLDETEEAPDVPSEEQEDLECEGEKIRGLSREEKELYAPFVQSRRSREQLVKAIDSISMAAYTGNIVITGDEGMDTMTLAKNMIREVKMTDRNFSGKVAKITGQGLNQKNVKQTLEELNNGALIIQDAAGMSKQTATALYCALQQERTGIIIAMEDTKKAMQKLFLGTPELYGCFTARMDLEAFSNDTLVSFGRRYAREMEYSIDDLGMLALHTRIEELQTIDHVVTVIEVKKIVDEAIRHAKRKTLGHFLDVLLAKRYDDEDMIILTEKDFVA